METNRIKLTETPEWRALPRYLSWAVLLLGASSVLGTV